MATLAEVVQAVANLESATVSGLQNLSTVIGAAVSKSQTGAPDQQPESEQFSATANVTRASNDAAEAIQKLAASVQSMTGGQAATARPEGRRSGLLSSVMGMLPPGVQQTIHQARAVLSPFENLVGMFGRRAGPGNAPAPTPDAMKAAEKLTHAGQMTVQAQTVIGQGEQRRLRDRGQESADTPRGRRRGKAFKRGARAFRQPAGGERFHPPTTRSLGGRVFQRPAHGTMRAASGLAGGAGRAAGVAAGVARAGGMATVAGGAAAGGIAAFGGPVGVVVAVAGALAALPSIVESFGRSLLEGQRGLSQFSGAMAAVFAASDVRGVFRERDVGNMTAGSARMLANAVDDLSDSFKETRALGSNVMNVLGTVISRAVEPLAKGIDAVAGKVNDILEWLGMPKEAENTDMATWLRQVKEEADRTNFERPWFQ